MTLSARHALNKIFKGAAVAAFSAFSISSATQAAQIPQFYVNSVVALGGVRSISTHGEPPHQVWVTEGTGIFYGYLVKNDPDPDNRKYEIYLVTARHVVEHHIQTQHDDLNVRLNAKNPSTGVQEYSIPNQPPAGSATWFYHPNKKSMSPAFG